jgi:hypothetical protein
VEAGEATLGGPAFDRQPAADLGQRIPATGRAPAPRGEWDGNLAPASQAAAPAGRADDPAGRDAPLTGLRMAQGVERLAGVLRANLPAGRPQPAPSQPNVERANQGVEPRSIEPLDSLAQRAAPPSEPIEVERLLEELAQRLELELLRTYGTSGR